MKVVDVMTRNPLTVSPSETIGQAEEIMTHDRFRQLPVDKDGKLVGLVTYVDLLRCFLHRLQEE